MNGCNCKKHLLIKRHDAVQNILFYILTNTCKPNNSWTQQRMFGWKMCILFEIFIIKHEEMRILFIFCESSFLNFIIKWLNYNFLKNIYHKYMFHFQSKTKSDVQVIYEYKFHFILLEDFHFFLKLFNNEPITYNICSFVRINRKRWKWSNAIPAINGNQIDSHIPYYQPKRCLQQIFNE